MSQNKKILFIIPSLDSGGAERQLIYLITGFKKSGYTPEIFIFKQKNELMHLLKPLNIKIYQQNFQYNDHFTKKIFKLIKIALDIYLLSRKNNYTANISFLPLANLANSIASKLARAKLIINSKRALNSHQDRIKCWKYMDYFSTWLSTAVICNSEAVKSDSINREGQASKFTVIKNILPVPNHNNSKKFDASTLCKNPHDYYICTISNLIHYKGLEYLIEAIHRLSHQYKNIKLLIIGEDRGELKKLTDLVAKYQITNHVSFVGQTFNTAAYLAISDLYVSPSLEEGFSNSIMEAINAGLAVVATKVGGTPELLNYGELGTLVPAKDVYSLSKAIADVVNNPKKHTNSETAIRAFRDKYSEANITNQYLAVIEGKNR